jgi:NitT/TauT family transport system substrate-binding protein
MPFSTNPLAGFIPLSRPVKLVLIFLVWLVCISWLHFRLNHQPASQQIVRMGYMPVVTNLAAPLLDHVSRSRTDVFFEAVKFSSFAEMAEALRNDSIQAAFIIAPLAVVLRQQGVDVKAVLVGNRHESTLVARKSLHAKRLEDLVGCTIAVPMRYSGHNLCLLKMIEEKRLGGKIRLVEMNPPDMAAALASGALDAYFVGEPFAAQTVLNDDADVVAYVESMWPNFICNLLLMKNDWMGTPSDRCTKTGRDGRPVGSLGRPLSRRSGPDCSRLLEPVRRVGTLRHDHPIRADHLRSLRSEDRGTPGHRRSHGPL